jgi:hypothetical protein
MPVVLRSGGFAISIYSREHPPPHVHVHYAGKRCRIELETLKLSRGSSMNRSEEARALRLVAAHREALLALWIQEKVEVR